MRVCVWLQAYETDVEKAKANSSKQLQATGQQVRSRVMLSAVAVAVA